MSTPSKPLVSIVLPCYNFSATLDQAFLSLINQTYPFFEIIAIDDGSKDDTRKVLLKWTDRDPRIRPFFLPHRGIYALNFGIYVCKGDYTAPE